MGGGDILTIDRWPVEDIADGNEVLDVLTELRQELNKAKAR